MKWRIMINTLHIGLSYKCNLRCTHCFVSIAKDRLNVDNCLNIIDDLIHEGLFFVVYTYGEPLLWPSFFELAEEVKKRGLVQILMTNGTLIDSNIAQKIKNSGINMVYVSIDSAAEPEHDQNRGVQGTYRKATDGIQILNESGISVGISTTVTANNFDKLDDIYRLAKKLGVKEISFLRERRNHCVIDLPSDDYHSFFKDHIGEVGSFLTFHDASLNQIILDCHKGGIISEEHKELLLDMNQCKNKYTLCVQPSGEMSKCNFSMKLNKNYFDVDLPDYLRSGEFKNENSICSTKL